MNNGSVDVKAILDECKKKGLKIVAETENGWRASTFYETEKAGDSSLSISKEGAFTCHRSQKTGFIVGLYADLIGRPFISAKADLREKGLIPKTYSEVKHVSPTKEDIDSEKQESEEVNKVESIMRHVRTDHDFSECSKWRGLPLPVLQKSVDLGFLGYVDAYPVLGSCYAFVCNTPPVLGFDVEVKGVMLRSLIPNPEKKNDKWRMPVTYPIWAPIWNKSATEVIFTEGQWDALAMQSLIDRYPNSADWHKFQVLALCGAKKLGKYPEIMEYLSGKKVYFVPDSDPAGEKILAETSVVLEQVCHEQYLLRVLDKQNDLNDWFKLSPIQDQFELWLESKDPFRVSNGFIIDEKFRYKHKIKLDSIVEVNDDGKPIEIYTGKDDLSEYIDPDYLLSIVEPFPVIHSYMKACSESIESPMIYHHASFMTYLAALCGRRFWMSSGSIGCLYPNLFTLLVGPSGLGKSESMKMLLKTVAKVNSRLFMSEDFSAESMVDEFKDNPQRILVCEEFSPWMQAKEGGYRFMAMKHFLRMHGCESYNSDRPYMMHFRKAGKIEIPEPYLCILSACTADQVFNVNSQLLTDGTVGRFFYPIGLTKHSSMAYTKPVSREVLDSVERFFRAINGTPIRSNMCMMLSPSAKRIYEAALEKQEALINSLDSSGDTRTYTSRWKIQFFKYCMLYEVSRPIHDIDEDKVRGEIKFRRSDMMISEEAAIAALKTVEVMFKSFESIFWNKMKSSECMTPNSKLQVRIIEFMRRNSPADGSGVTTTDILRYTHENASVLKPILDSMVEGGIAFVKQVFPKDEKTGLPIKNRKPKTVYLLAKESKSDVIPNPIRKMSENQNHNGTNQSNGQNHHENNLGPKSRFEADLGLGVESELRPSLGDSKDRITGISPDPSGGLVP